MCALIASFPESNERVNLRNVSKSITRVTNIKGMYLVDLCLVDCEPDA